MMKPQPKIQVNIAVQSDFRENDTQTEPWTPKFRVTNGKPEVLRLGFMKYKRDLPAWSRTIDAIEFMRKKRAWEKYLVKMYTPEKSKYCKRIISDIEACEMQLMANDFDRENKKRLELAAAEGDYINYVMDQRFKERDQFVSKEIAKRKEAKLRSIRAKKTRELRKIDLKQRGVNMKYHHLSPIEEMCDPLSPFQVSVARFGKNPRYGTEVLPRECTLTNMKTLRSMQQKLFSKVPSLFGPTKSAPKKHNCSVLKDVEIPEIGSMSDPFTDTAPLLTNDSMRTVPKSLIVLQFPTPQQEKDYQAVLLLQTLIRGRAVQNLMYRGRREKQATIDEFQFTMAFSKEEEQEVDLRKRCALQKLRYYHLHMKMIGMVAQVQRKLLSSAIGDEAMNAQQEEERLAEVRRADLVAALAERTREHREAVEAGRRQKELQIKALNDELHRQMVAQNEMTTDFYLNLIEEQVVRKVVEKEADKSTKLKADELEKLGYGDVHRRKHETILRRETMARLLHNLYIPQISKDMDEYSLDYNYISEARKTATDLIIERSKIYDSGPAKTPDVGLVADSKTELHPEYSQELIPFDLELHEQSETEAFEFEDEVEFSKMSSTEEFKRQATLDVISDAEKLAKEASMYKHAILDRLQFQEEERQKSMETKPQTKRGTVEDCYKQLYGYHEDLVNYKDRVSAVKSTEIYEEDELEIRAMDEPGETDSVSVVSTIEDFIDRRLLVNSDGETTDDSSDGKCYREHGDMPERLIDRLLYQAEYQQHEDEHHVEKIATAIKSRAESIDSVGSTEVEPESLKESFGEEQFVEEEEYNFLQGFEERSEESEEINANQYLEPNEILLSDWEEDESRNDETYEETNEEKLGDLSTYQADDQQSDVDLDDTRKKTTDDPTDDDDDSVLSVTD